MVITRATATIDVCRDTVPAANNRAAAVLSVVQAAGKTNGHGRGYMQPIPTGFKRELPRASAQVPGEAAQLQVDAITQRTSTYAQHRGQAGQHWGRL